MGRAKKTNEFVWKIPKSDGMKVDATIFASDLLMSAIERDKTLSQVENVAKLPGIVGTSIAMPDAHQGYGFSIGGVAAFDLKNGIISPGGVGYDINCGVRLLATNITVEDFEKKKDVVSKAVFDLIPAGVGNENKERLSNEELDRYLTLGAKYAIEKGMGREDDLIHCEEHGCIDGCDVRKVGQRAKARGKAQLGTLGSGNHFLEFQAVSEIFDEAKAKEFGLTKGTVCVMIHCGSRGLGHQIASDYIQKMEKAYGFDLIPDRELIYAPLDSDLGRDYVSAMNCAINFAFANRQIIMHRVRGVLETFFPNSKNHLVYDVCHNIAKIEEHVVDGVTKKVCVHRKGATRAFSDQPVLIPGSMGTASYVLVGTKKAHEVSFGSTAHGAGRVMSRSNAIKTLDADAIESDLNKKGISIFARSRKGIKEEAPEVYKDIDEVVRVSDSLGIAKRVCKLLPLSVIKG